MVALPAGRGVFDIAQQLVHFVEIEGVVGAHGFVAGEAREDLVFETGDGGARRVLAQFVQQFADDFRRGRVFEQGGNGGDVNAARV